MTTVDFSGLLWRVKDSAAAKVGPGPNIFSADNVSADGRGLHLEIARAKREWTCAEVIAQGTFGFGDYSWTVRSDLTRLDGSAVLGLFTWSDVPEHAHREIDIEIARWNRRDPALSGLFTVQSGRSGNSFPFSLEGSGRSLHTMTWAPGEVTFSSSCGVSSAAWTFRGEDVPQPGGGVAPRANLWLFRGGAPSAAQSVTIETFHYRAADTRPAATPPTTIEGTWVPVRIRLGDRLTAADPSRAAEVVLIAGRASGRGGVNRFSSTYTVGEGDVVSFAGVVSTRMAGPERAMAQEAAFFAALGEAARFELDAGDLVLKDVGGSTLLVLAPG